jgi:peroxiredoxin
MKNNYTIICCRAVLWLSLILFGVSASAGQDGKGYEIKVQIKGIPDTVCYLANYYGDKTYLTDTAAVEADGNFAFTGDTALPGGIYIIAGQSNNKYFEILVNDISHFSIRTSIAQIPDRIEFEGSPDNTLFYGYVNENVRYRRKIEALSQELKKQAPGADSANLLKDQINELYDRISSFEDSLIKANSNSFVAVVLKAKQEPELAPPVYLSNGKEDSLTAYLSYKEHFWDNLNPSDERLLRTPLYHMRLKKYFEKVLYQQPDTLIHEADKFIKKASGSSETLKYAIWYLTYKFETSNVMGFDEVFVHMVDAYYAKGLAYWTDSSVVKSLMNRADELRNVLIGSQAPNLVLLDTLGNFKSLYSVEAEYLIVLFYEYGCSHCRKEIKALKAWYFENPFNAEVFAVNTDTSLAAWRKFIREQDLNWIHVNGTRSVTPDYHGLYDIRVTPTIYVLDERKKIIAKRLKTEQLMPFLEGYHKKQWIHRE